MRTELPMARKMWRSLEPYHGMVYFAPEPRAAYTAIGLEGDRMGYFASRAAAMGPVPAEVVIATFFNFHPGLVRRWIPSAWQRADPAEVLDARLTGANRALRRLLGDSVVSGDDMAEAATLAREATTACRPEGRPLYAAHASLAWPDEPHLVLWHAVTLLREFRGDGHIAALVVDGVGGCKALVLHAATGEIPAAVLQASRAWPDDEWRAAVEGLEDRGWLGEDGLLTDTGRHHRREVEDRTDELAGAPWAHLGDDSCDRLRALVRPWSRAIVEAGTFLPTDP